MEYQKKIIEAEREKRDFHDKLEQERQASIQALKKLEKQKRDLERLQQESAAIARETRGNMHPCIIYYFLIFPAISNDIKGTIRPDWICMRVAPLDSPLKGYQPLYSMFLIFNS